MTNAAEQFRAAIERAGLTPPTDLVGDGMLHRFPSNGKPGDDAAWYVLHCDGIPAGAFGDWRTGLEQTWRADVGRLLTEQEARLLREHAAAQRTARDEEQRRRRTEAAEKALAVWKASFEVEHDHPYLVRKGVAPVATLREAPIDLIADILGYRPRARDGRLEGRILVAPIKVDGHLSSIEMIDESGRKSALVGGAKAGGYWAAQCFPDGEGAGNTFLLGEGIATVLSAHQATGHDVVAALSCGNLSPVALWLTAQFPRARLVILADLGNGESEAVEAARSTGALLAVPDFGGAGPDGASDFNDLARHRGEVAVRRCIDGAARVEPAGAAKAVVSSPSSHPQASRAQGAFLDAVQIIRADTIQPEPVDWLWQDYLAAGKLHILAGAPGTGKTTLALALAATMACAGRWPDGEPASVGSVLIWSGEDSPADTLVPRLIASGAESRRVHFVGNVDDAEGRRPFDPATDFPTLERAATAIPDLRLVIVDPLVSAVAGDSHKNAEVRRGLQPLVDFAAATRCAVIGISHFSKGTSGKDPTERVTGSLAFGALARIVLATAKASDDAPEGTRLLVRAKSNLGPDGGGFQYVLRTVELTGPHMGIVASRVEWGQVLEGDARDLLAAAEQEGDDDERSATEDAAEMLRSLLAHGRVSTKDARRALKAEGFSDKQIRRARESLGVRRERDGYGGPDYWRLPTTVPGSCPAATVPDVYAPSSGLGSNRHELGNPNARVAVHAHTSPTTKQGHERQEREQEGMNGADAEVL